MKNFLSVSLEWHSLWDLGLHGIEDIDNELLKSRSDSRAHMLAYWNMHFDILKICEFGMYVVSGPSPENYNHFPDSVERTIHIQQIRTETENRTSRASLAVRSTAKNER